jgi:predicted nucleotidyltransferase
VVKKFLPASCRSGFTPATIRPRLSPVSSTVLAQTAAPTLPPPPDEIARRLAPLCRAHGITRLEIFGSVARGDAQPGSDVDLIATLSKPLGFRFYGLGDDMELVLGVRVHLLTREQIETMTNPYYRASILPDIRTIYDARTDPAAAA